MRNTITTDLPEMTADEFLAWAIAQPKEERYELHDRRIVAMSPERWGHAVLKTRIAHLLIAAVRDAGLSCDVTADGMAVRSEDAQVFEPDVLVRCGAPMASEEIEVKDPMIVVEVLSPATAARDRTVKLAGYFRIPSVRHYLLVSGDERRIVHHRRITDTEFATSVVGTDPIILDPPGIALRGVFD